MMMNASERVQQRLAPPEEQAAVEEDMVAVVLVGVALPGGGSVIFRSREKIGRFRGPFRVILDQSIQSSHGTEDIRTS